jgi:hypothetical protein
MVPDHDVVLPPDMAELVFHLRGVSDQLVQQRHRVAKRFGRQRLVADAQHQIVVQDTLQCGLRRRIGQAIEVDTAHRRGHVAAELLGPKTHGVAPNMRDNVRAELLNLKRGNP